MLTLGQIATLSALANGIIPADTRDSGAAAVHAGPGIAGRIRYNPYADVYLDGLRDAERFAREMFDRETTELEASQMDQLIAKLRDESQQFFRLIRSDVCAMYLSDRGVWQRMGFPGESTEEGGHPDFDQDQSTRS